jgi:hypothetical protein
MNTLPESITKKIEDEAEKPCRQREQELKAHHKSSLKLEYVEGYADGYENAAEAILSKPGDYGLAGSWVKGIDRSPLDMANKEMPIRWKNNGGDWIYGVGDFVGYFRDNHRGTLDTIKQEVEYLHESTTPSDRVQQLEQALREIESKVVALIKEDPKGRAIEVAIIMANTLKEISSITTNALKTI